MGSVDTGVLGRISSVVVGVGVVVVVVGGISNSSDCGLVP